VHRLEVLVEAFLGRLVVIGADDERGVGAGLLGDLGGVDRMRRRVEAGAGDDRRASGRDLDRHLDQALLLVVFKGRAFAGRADRHQPVSALAELPGDMLLKRLVVDRAVPERGDQRNQRPLEHGILPARTAAQLSRSSGAR
jgi:hypothetical protein